MRASLILALPGRPAEIALGLLTMGLGLYSLSRRGLGLESLPAHRSASGMAAGGAVLFAIGVLNGSLTSGTGLFVTLWLVRWFGLEYREAVAYTLVLVGLFWNGAGAVTLGSQGAIEWTWLPVLLAGSVIGGYMGAHLAARQGSRWIKRGYEAVTLLVGAKLIIG